MSVSGFGAEIEKCDEILFVSKATQTAGVDIEEESEVNHLVKAEENSAHVQITASLSEVSVTSHQSQYLICVSVVICCITARSE